jgi:MFS family permease
MSARRATALAETGRRTFAAFAIPNYRRYFYGQATSLIGTWMQSAAQAWLVLSLTGSAAALGGIVALQALPVLLLAPYGGVIADRVDKRRLMVVLQTAMGLQALALGVLTITAAVTLWEIAVLAVLLGLNNAFENPARQSFVLEMVGADSVRNAVSLNAVQVNVARAIGPAVAGVMIATVGTGECFLVNALSFAAVVGSLLTMDRAALSPTTPARRAAGQLREGVRYAFGVREIAVPLLMMGLIGTFAYEFQVSLPVMARGALHAGAEGYGFMTAAIGVGAAAGGLVVAARGRTGLRPATIAAGAFGAAMALAAAAPDLAVELVALAVVGATSVSFMSIGNSTLQLAAEPEMRGRVMALWFVALQGTTPVGGPAIGGIIAAAGARAGLLAGAAACALAVVLAGWIAQRRRVISGPAGPESVLVSLITGTAGPVSPLDDDERSAPDRGGRGEPPLADPRSARPEPARRGARHEHPQRGVAAALRAQTARVGDDAEPARMDPERLHAGLRRTAVHLGSAGRPDRPQDDAAVRNGGVRRLLGAVGVRRQPR